MPGKVMSPSLIITALLIAGVSLTACSGGNINTASSNVPTAAQSTPAASTPTASPKSGFEADLDYVRKGQYTYIWLFSRKDGKPLDKNDGAFLRTNAPQVVDWVTTDEGKKVIGGTNFDLEKGNLNLLKKRFIVEDYTGK